MWTTRDGSLNSSPRKKRSLIKLKIVVFSPIPSAKVITAINVNAGDLRGWRKANFKSLISFGAESFNNIDARSARRGHHRRDYCDRQQDKRRGGHGKKTRHGYISEIAACYTRTDEAEYRACQDARGCHRGAFGDDIFEKTLRLRPKSQSNSELAHASVDGKREHAGDADHRNRQSDRCEHAKHDRVQTLRAEHFRAGVFQGRGALNGLLHGHAANDPRDRRDQRIRIYTGVDEQPP